MAPLPFRSRHSLILLVAVLALVPVSIVVATGEGRQANEAVAVKNKPAEADGMANRAPEKNAPAKTGSISPTQAFSDYRTWRCANVKPIWIPDQQAAMCAVLPPSRQTTNPHAGKYVRVYVNRIGQKPFLKMKNPSFARGSIIVKEKLADRTSKTPQLLTAMVKREAGFDSANGDWEYLVLNGTATKITQRGKLSNCQGCHVPQKESGYVFRDYLPEVVERKLR